MFPYSARGREGGIDELANRYLAAHEADDATIAKLRTQLVAFGARFALPPRLDSVLLFPAPRCATSS